MVSEQGSRRPERLRATARHLVVLLVLAAAGVVTGRLLVLGFDGWAPAAAPPLPSPSPATATVSRDPGPLRHDDRVAGRSVRGAAAVLHAWDAARATAYARGDPAALRDLYAPGSRAGARDVEVLEAYAARGLLVRGLRTQVLALRVLSRGQDRLTLRVTDRSVGGWAVMRSAVHGSRRDRGVALPWDGPTERVVVLGREVGDWQVRSVRPV